MGTKDMSKKDNAKYNSYEKKIMVYIRQILSSVRKALNNNVLADISWSQCHQSYH